MCQQQISSIEPTHIISFEKRLSRIGNSVLYWFRIVFDILLYLCDYYKVNTSNPGIAFLFISTAYHVNLAFFQQHYRQ